ncbi:MAG TPA: M15 family metallopeptidase [Woeseiaceae bacterium]|nr:M15 family metallopeptidase [Woeseiaceae bacterium]
MRLCGKFFKLQERLLRRPLPVIVAAALAACAAAPGGAAPGEPAGAIGEDGVFRIRPQRPVAELKAEALAAEPPATPGARRAPELVELTALDPTLRLDIRYAGTDNFLGTRLYDEPRAFLQRPAAEALVRAHRAARAHGYGFLIHDAYRPWWVTKVFWDATPERLRQFVADPASGSRHNRGAAVDLTLYDLETGQPADMPSLYDEFTERARPDYAGGTAGQRARRDLLRALMEAEGFTVYEEEWWHFDHEDWEAWPILNVTFEALDAAAEGGACHDGAECL